MSHGTGAPINGEELAQVDAADGVLEKSGEVAGSKPLLDVELAWVCAVPRRNPKKGSDAVPRVLAGYDDDGGTPANDGAVTIPSLQLLPPFLSTLRDVNRYYQTPNKPDDLQAGRGLRSCRVSRKRSFDTRASGR
jgi:hypothetical protein